SSNWQISFRVKWSTVSTLLLLVVQPNRNLRNPSLAVLYRILVVILSAVVNDCCDVTLTPCICLFLGFASSEQFSIVPSYRGSTGNQMNSILRHYRVPSCSN